MLLSLKPLSFIAIIIFMICLKQSQCINEELLNPKLTIEEMLNSKWRLSNGDGDLGEFIFYKDGRFSMPTINWNAFWTFDGKVLRLLNTDRSLNTRMHHFYRDFYGKWHIRGPYVGLNDWEDVIIQV